MAVDDIATHKVANIAIRTEWHVGVPGWLRGAILYISPLDVRRVHLNVLAELQELS